MSKALTDKTIMTHIPTSTFVMKQAERTGVEPLSLMALIFAPNLTSNFTQFR